MDVLSYRVDFLNVRTEIMAFYFAYFLSFSLVILPFAQAVKQGISSETALPLCDFFHFSKRESNGRGIGKHRKRFGD